ncbi:nucleotidyltransferase [Flavobacterium covae]|uniref:Nucleotidyltransferase n=1 Tax=Flavobacterium columnare TaxID=996 RepID=A0A8G0KSC9_9FLAO|nr:nucleotidyltransferase [Flavobacterium davisii]QYS89171.1 nucleotidyltransferase [Flavobacterium davisii]
MARSIEEIHGNMLANIANHPDLQELNSTSKTAIYRLFCYIVAVAIWSLDQLFSIHKIQITTAIYEYKPGTLRWYRNMALAFQFGFNLKPDDDQFNNQGATTEQIETSKIVKYCSVKEGLESSKVILKVAGEQGDNLRKLSADEIRSFTAYMKEVSFAGVKLLIINNPADKLLLKMDVYIDPLLFDSKGTNVRLGSKTVEIDLKKYLKNLPFDGELVVNDLIAHLRSVDGVINVNITTIQSSYLDLTTNTYTPFTAINVKTIPLAGYFEIDNQSVFKYVV